MAGNKDNMKQAMKELLGMVGIGPEGEEGTAPDLVEPQPQPIPQAVPQPVQAPEREEETVTVNFLNEKPAPEMREPEREIPPVRPVVEPPRKPVQDSIFNVTAPTKPVATRAVTPGSTIIAAGTIIVGDIRCQGDVECQGNLKGNLDTAGNVRITGKIIGDIRGSGIELVGCAVQGNVIAEGEVHMDQTAVVVGDVNTSVFQSDGKVKGDVQVQKSANFQKNAILVGNVRAGLISVSEGARIQGTIQVESASDNIPDFGVDMEL